LIYFFAGRPQNNPDGGFDGTGGNTVRFLLKEKYATKDTCICDCNPADAGLTCAWTRWWWFERWLGREFGQHRLQWLDFRWTRILDWHHKFGSERHGTNTCTDAGPVVQLSIELWHAWNRFKRYPHSERDRPDAGAHARSINVVAQRIRRHNRIGTAPRVRFVLSVRYSVNVGRRHDRWWDTAHC
jgi:hypothetical protein